MKEKERLQTRLLAHSFDELQEAKQIYWKRTLFKIRIGITKSVDSEK